jgi:Na+-transporting NADH:ubiquinone oxidoreductase subunit A
VHIHHLDPIRNGRKVWTVRGVDLPPIGELLLEGTLPTHRTIAVGGPAIRAEARCHRRVRVGAPWDAVLEGRLAPGEVRAIAGDVLAGRACRPGGGVGWRDVSVTAIHEDRERRLLGWMTPGLGTFSHSRTFLSAWLRRGARWDHRTNLNGSPRAMVLTGLYDRVMPMRMMTDALVRAVLAHDVEEAVRLGLLETDPEDFALPAFVCPSKTDLPGIIRAGLAEVEAEG